MTARPWLTLNSAEGHCETTGFRQSQHLAWQKSALRCPVYHCIMHYTLSFCNTCISATPAANPSLNHLFTLVEPTASSYPLLPPNMTSFRQSSSSLSTLSIPSTCSKRHWHTSPTRPRCVPLRGDNFWPPCIASIQRCATASRQRAALRPRASCLKRTLVVCSSQTACGLLLSKRAAVWEV